MRKVLLALLFIIVLSSFAGAAYIDPTLLKAAKEATALDVADVVVMMNADSVLVDVSEYGGVKKSSFAMINGLSAEIPLYQIEELAKDPNVYSIIADYEVNMNLDIALCATNAENRYDTPYTCKYTGDGQLIAVLDTGIYPHQDFGSRIIGFRDYVNGYTYPYDDHGHGTHCAGVAAGNGTVYYGPAREANLLGIKVLNQNGSGYMSDILSGVQYAVQNRADVILLPLGGTCVPSSTDPLCAALRYAWNSGVVVVVSSGGGMDISTPGNEPMIITVKASNDNGTCTISDDTVSSYPAGPTCDGYIKPDVVAPGVAITACSNTGGYTTFSGSSPAASLVGGIAAQVLEANPGWSPNHVKMALMGSARDLGYSIYVQGAGIVDSREACRYPID